MSTVEEVFACHTYDATLWTHGWVDKRKFKGRLLSRMTGDVLRLDSDYEKEDIIRGRVVQGWVLTVAGDVSGCGWDATTYFVTDYPQVVGGRWDGAEGIEYDDEGNETELDDVEVIDGPHQATWLEVKT